MNEKVKKPQCHRRKDKVKSSVKKVFKELRQKKKSETLYMTFSLCLCWLVPASSVYCDSGVILTLTHSELLVPKSAKMGKLCVK